MNSSYFGSASVKCVRPHSYNDAAATDAHRHG